MASIIDLPHELIELIVELSDDKSSLYLIIVLKSPILERQVYLKNKFTRAIEVNGTTTYRLPNGKLHREYDLPAIVGRRGSQWYYNGRCHREDDKPAIITSDGSQAWYYNGNRHRGSLSDPTLNVDLPAVIGLNGTQYWYYNNKCHREGDKPAIIYVGGTQYWYYNDLPHREDDKPAIICISGARRWYYNGKCYRETAN